MHAWSSNPTDIQQWGFSKKQKQNKTNYFAVTDR